MKKTGFFIAFLIAVASEDFFVFLMMTLDVLPLKYVLLVLVLIGILDAAIAIPLFRKKYGGTARLAGLVVFMLTLNIMLLGSYVMYNTYVTLDKISVENDTADKAKVTEEPFNICITGIDMWGDIDQVSRSDVNMIMTVNPETRTILLTSMPRDSYVVLHSFGEYDKLTHTGVWGTEETISTIEDWLDVELNYYVRVDFSMLVHVVHEIGGIDVYSDYDFESSISDHYYKKGWNHLWGMGALYFARERHAFKNEDQQRIINQQKVMKACLRKIMKSETLLTSYTGLLKVVENEMETNLSEKEMASLVRMQLDDMRGWKMITQSVQGDLTMKGTYTMGMDRELLVSIPREKSVEKVKKKIQDTMYPQDNGTN